MTTHLLTVAVEDYFQVSAFGGLIGEHQWGRFESRVAVNTERVLDLLDEHDIRATFFALGWIAERMPEVVRAIADRGHEVASKGFYHRPIQAMSREEFRDDAVQTREAIERALCRRVLGHRVAQGTLRCNDLWALDVLAEEGFAYDSSIYPRMRSIAQEPSRRFPHAHRHHSGLLWEVPLSSIEAFGLHVPVAGGNYFRQFPYALMRRAFTHWDRSYDAPFNMYFHVWELDPDLPRISAAGPITRIRQYRNIDKMQGILSRYLQAYRFQGIASYLGLQAGEVEPPPRREPPVPEVVLGVDRPPVTVVVPCFNEERALPLLANALAEVETRLAPRYELTFLFVDDRSTDDTWAELQRCFGNRPSCRFVRHDENRGVAAAILTGVRAADTEVVCSIDADCTYDPHQLEAMIPELTGDVDMVTASPYHPAGEVRNVPGHRLLLSKMLSRMYQGVLRHRFYTYTSCLRVYRRSALADLELEHGDFLGVAETLGRLDLAGARIVEHPAVLEVRMLGRSKMKPLRTIAGHLRLLVELSHRAPRRVWCYSAVRCRTMPLEPTARSFAPPSLPHTP